MRVRHCGKRGDVIYAMAAMKRLYELDGQRVRVVLNDFWLPPVAKESLVPLLASQPYIDPEIEDEDGEVCEVDFMEWIHDYDHHRNAVQAVLDFVTSPIHADVPIDTDNPAQPWLEIDVPENGLTLINWTGRYLNEDVNKRFDWGPLLAEIPAARFIGLPEEHTAFCEHFHRDVAYEPTANLLDAAQRIAGCSLFMGNQSAPLALAHALGKRVIVESAEENPNCIFNGRGSLYYGVSAETIAQYKVDC